MGPQLFYFFNLGELLVSQSPKITVTRILEAAKTGDTAAMEQLFPLVYEELHQRAHWQRQKMAWGFDTKHHGFSARGLFEASGSNEGRMDRSSSLSICSCEGH